MQIRAAAVQEWRKGREGLEVAEGGCRGCAGVRVFGCLGCLDVCGFLRIFEGVQESWMICITAGGRKRWSIL